LYVTGQELRTLSLDFPSFVTSWALRRFGYDVDDMMEGDIT